MITLIYGPSGSGKTMVANAIKTAYKTLGKRVSIVEADALMTTVQPEAQDVKARNEAYYKKYHGNPDRHLIIITQSPEYVEVPPYDKREFFDIILCTQTGRIMNQVKAYVNKGINNTEVRINVK